MVWLTAVFGQSDAIRIFFYLDFAMTRYVPMRISPHMAIFG